MLALLADVLSLVLLVLLVLLASLVLRCCRVAGWRGGDDAERKSRSTCEPGGELALFRMANHTAVRRHYFATAANGSMHLHIPYATRAR